MLAFNLMTPQACESMNITGFPYLDRPLSQEEVSTSLAEFDPQLLGTYPIRMWWGGQGEGISPDTANRLIFNQSVTVARYMVQDPEICAEGEKRYMLTDCPVPLIKPFGERHHFDADVLCANRVSVVVCTSMARQLP